MVVATTIKDYAHIHWTNLQLMMTDLDNSYRESIKRVSQETGGVPGETGDGEEKENTLTSRG